ncbi:MAG: hypothetical protein NZ518_01830 [Dehalococcoidia bacterium]|nr:hypothetical protein [Dehalococcoidia bacterium]
MWRPLLAVIVALAATACVSGADTGSPAPEPTAPPDAQALVAAAREDLARTKAASPDAIRLRSVTARQFPDTSLGCPQPGMMYQQVITPGWVIELTLHNDVYTYHAGRNRVVRCDGR